MKTVQSGHDAPSWPAMSASLVNDYWTLGIGHVTPDILKSVSLTSYSMPS